MKLLLKKSIMIKIAIALGVLVSATLLMKKSGMTYRQSVLKTMYPLIMWSSSASGKKQTQQNVIHATPTVSFYSLHMKDINGNEFNFENLKGKKVLVVNTASDCGFTGQYEALETLSKKYQNNLVVIGIPSNDFKEQETKDNKAIAEFCKKNYGVSFPLMEKAIVIKKNHQNEVHKWLSDMTLNGWCHQEPAWNFCKYLINEKGELMYYFPMTVDPMSVELTTVIEAQ